MAAAALAVAAIIVIYFSFDPQTGLFPRCPSKMLTGLDCPGCGAQRALHALLHGDLTAALRFNALMVAALPFTALLAVVELKRKSNPKLYAALNSRPVILTTLAVVILWGILRNIL